MFSYQHAFHAGNHADVLKHAVLVHALKYATQKEAPLYYVDTHAGAGMYILDRKEAQKNREYDSGIGRLWPAQDLPELLDDYVGLIKALNPEGQLRHYPGSPWVAEQLLRKQDRIRLFELHPKEFRLLEQLFSRSSATDKRGKRALIEKMDGFAALKGQLPPPSRRAVVLIDPPYENKQDYRAVLDTLRDAARRFSTGTYLIWYPVLTRPESRRFGEQLRRQAFADWLEVSLNVRQGRTGERGLYASSVFVLNPPFRLREKLEEAMPMLVKLLGEDSAATYGIETGATLVKSAD